MTGQHPQAWAERDALKAFIQAWMKEHYFPSWDGSLNNKFTDALLASGIISRKPTEEEIAEVLKREWMDGESSDESDRARLHIARAVLSAKGEGE